MAAAENIKGENRLRTDPERGIMQADQNRREPMFAFNHFNFNVTDLERSIAFYHDALGLEPVRRKEAADGSFILTFLENGVSAGADLAPGSSPEIRSGRVRIPLGSGGGGYGKGPRSPRKAGLHLLREPGHGYLFYL